MAEFKITKRYGRKVSRDYQTWEFLTEMSKTVNVESAEELVNENVKLFNQVKGLTETDIDNCSIEMQPQREE